MKKTSLLSLLFVLVVARVAWAAPASPAAAADPAVVQDQATCPAPATSTDGVSTPADTIVPTPFPPTEQTDATCPSPTAACSSMPGCGVDSCVTYDSGDNTCSDGSVILNCGAHHDAGYRVCQCKAVVPGSLCFNQAVSWLCL